MGRVLGRSGLVVTRSDLFDEDVRLPSVPGNVSDHAQVDESQVHRADGSVFGGDVEAAVAAGALCPSQSSAAMAARVRWNQMRSAAAQCLIRENRGREGGHELLTRLGIGERLDGSHQFSTN